MESFSEEESDACLSPERSAQQTKSQETIPNGLDMEIDLGTVTPELDQFMKELQAESANFMRTLHKHNKGKAFSLEDDDPDLSYHGGDELGRDSMVMTSAQLDGLLSSSSLAPDSFMDTLPSNDLDSMISARLDALPSIKSKSGEKAQRVDEDDEMDDEMRRLEAAEDNLRKELDFASAGFGWLGSPEMSTVPHELERLDNASMHSLEEKTSTHQRDVSREINELDNTISQSQAKDPTAANNDESRTLNNSKTTNGGDIQKRSHPSYMTPVFRSPETLSEKAIHIGLHRLPSDLGVYTCPIFLPITQPSKDENDLKSSIENGLIEHNSNDFNLNEAWKLRQQELQEESMFRQHFAREYVDSMTPQTLRKILVGLTDPKPPKHLQQALHQHLQQQLQKGQLNDSAKKLPLLDLDDKQYKILTELQMLHHPVRTCIIRVRPDVLCGSVVDALANILVDEAHGEILKKQGGHLRGIVPPTFRNGDELSFRISARHAAGLSRKRLVDSGDNNMRSSEVKLLPPFVVDAQLCTKKRSKDCERVVLIRIYGVPRDLASDIPPTYGEMPDDEGLESTNNGSGLREVGLSSTVCDDECEIPGIWDASRTLHDIKLQEEDGTVENTELNKNRLNSPNARTRREDLNKTPSTAQKIGSILSSPKAILFSSNKKNANRKNINSTPGDNVSTFPSMSNKDAPLVESAWIFIKKCTEELEIRDLAYSSLSKCAFGKFPALTTLDNHFCSQLRMLVRERMVISLLKTASELENFARDAEFSCANFVQLLKPAFNQMYQLNQPKLPEPIPLSAYPLDFASPEATCPPWGQKVMECLNRISTEASDQPPTDNDTSGTANGKNGFDLASRAVSSVVAAFQRQDDEEQSARLGRKNMQVMDRLAKMQAHKKNLLLNLASEYGRNPHVTAAADNFHSKAESFFSTYDDPEGMLHHILPAMDQVPLLQCGIFVGGATGQCFVTAHEMLCTTQLIPLVGGNQNYLFYLRNIELEVTAPLKHSLIQLPPGISIIRTRSSGRRETVLKLIPSIEAQRFKDFIDVLREVELDSVDSLMFSQKGGFLYTPDDDKESEARGQHTAIVGS